MKNKGSLILTRSEVADLLDLESCIQAVEDAFRWHEEGAALHPGVLSTHASDGAFHVKAAGVQSSRLYYAAKINANFPQNTKKFGLPSIQGIILLCDGQNGYPLAVIDSIEITILRTGAATAVAAKYLAAPEAETALIWGCGNQGRIQLKSIAKIVSLKRVFAYDADSKVLNKFVADLSQELNIEVIPTSDPLSAARFSQICVTCTPSRTPLIGPENISEGAFIAGVGADNPQKHELAPELLTRGKIVVDLLDQCLVMGDLHHAVERGIVRADQVHAELGEIVCGKKKGRESKQEIIIFDSTGTALQDVAVATIVYEKALKRQSGRWIDFQK
ncbi:ornithine cyclodeaminase family protein [bacterium]|nr:ornithine cyclodeaminase family protein [bacterium]